MSKIEKPIKGIQLEEDDGVVYTFDASSIVYDDGYGTVITLKEHLDKLMYKPIEIVNITFDENNALTINIESGEHYEIANKVLEWELNKDFNEAQHSYTLNNNEITPEKNEDKNKLSFTFSSDMDDLITNKTYELSVNETIDSNRSSSDKKTLSFRFYKYGYYGWTNKSENYEPSDINIGTSYKLYGNSFSSISINLSKPDQPQYIYFAIPETQINNPEKLTFTDTKTNMEYRVGNDLVHFITDDNVNYNEQYHVFRTKNKVQLDINLTIKQN